jgi:thymidylate kinase
MNAALLHEASSLTEALLLALDRDEASLDEIVAALAQRQGLLDRLDRTTVVWATEREAAEDLQTLDARLARALDERRRAVASQIAHARRRTAVQPTSARLVLESA